MKKRIIAGNWKSNTTWTEAKQLVEELSRMTTGKDINTRVVIAPPTPYLAAIRSGLPPMIALAAQNCSANDTGAFTGEYTAGMLASVGVKYVIVGHSERRAMYNETDEVVAQKVRQVLDAGLYSILCVGESLEERESDRHFDVVKTQIEAAFTAQIGKEEANHVVVAYEPVWAIGTGKTASDEQAQEMHAHIRHLLNEAYGEVASDISILYGGSVKPGNAAGIFQGEDVDGGLIGGASLKAEDFMAIIEANSEWTTVS